MRNMILEVLNRLPNNDVLKAYMKPLLHLCSHILATDSEDNALISLRVVFELHKNFRPLLADEVQSFLDFVKNIYSNLPDTVKRTFGANFVSNVGDDDESSSSEAGAAKAKESSSDATNQGSAAVETNAKDTSVVEADSTAAATVTSSPGKEATISTAPGEDISTTLASETNGDAADAEAKNGDSEGETKRRGEVPVESRDDAMDVDSVTGKDNGSSASASGVAAVATYAAVEVTKSAETPDSAAVRSNSSFKVLTECPLIVMLLFQLYPHFIPTNINVLIPLMMNTLKLKFKRIPKEKALRQKFCDFIACQVKTLSFLTYLLRGFDGVMRPYEATISDCVVSLLKSCPSESITTRRELLVATRHILATDFRKGFFSQIDALLQAPALIGSSRASYELLRPLAYSTLADLVHHMRTKLNMAQLQRIIFLFSRNIHDATLPLSIQTTSVRLLLNLVDNIFHNKYREKTRGRVLLVTILVTLTDKFGTLKRQIARIEKSQKMWTEVEQKARKADQITLFQKETEGMSPTDLLKAFQDERLAADNTMDLFKDTIDLLPKSNEKKTPTKTIKNKDANAEDREAQKESATLAREKFLQEKLVNTVKDAKQLIKTMILGLKTVVWCVSNYNRQAATMDKGKEKALAKKSIHRRMYESEMLLLVRFFRKALCCFSAYSEKNARLSEKKEVLDHFAAVFTVLDAHSFQDLFRAQMDLLSEYLMTDQAMITIPQHLLSNANTSSVFANILLRFLVDRIPDLSPDTDVVDDAKEVDASSGDASSKKTEEGVTQSPLAKKNAKKQINASVLVRLFKLVFHSIVLFADNELVLQPYLAQIVKKAISCAVKSKKPVNFLLLVRALFRRVAAGKFELLYKEFVPLLPGTLEALLRLQAKVSSQATADMLVELCLLIPAPLSSLLQHLSLLLQPVILALRSRDELAHLGLRTLELWIDSLNPDYLYPIMSTQPLLSELMKALCDLLRPGASVHSALAIRLLGKLGGRNRWFLKKFSEVRFKERSTSDFVLNLKFASTSSFKVSCDHVAACVVDFLEVHLDAPKINVTGGGSSTKATIVTAAISEVTKHPFSSSPGKFRKRRAFVSSRGDNLSYQDSRRNSLGNFNHRLSASALDPKRVREHKTIAMRVAYSMLASLFPSAGGSENHEDAWNDVEHCVRRSMKAFAAAPRPSTKCAKTRAKRSKRSLPEDALFALLLCAADKDVGKVAKPLATNFVRQLALLVVASDADEASSTATSAVDPIFVTRALADALSFESRGVASTARDILSDLIRTIDVVLADKSLSVTCAQSSLYTALCEQLVSICYCSSWKSQLGATRALVAMNDRLDRSWALRHNIELCRGLLYIVKGQVLEVLPQVLEVVCTALYTIVRGCFGVEGTSNSNGKNDTTTSSSTSDIAELVRTVTMELSSRHAPVREMSGKLLETLAKCRGCSISDLIRDHCKDLRSYIFVRQFRVHPIDVQVGLIDALIFGLQQNPPLFVEEKKLMNLLKSVVQLSSRHNPDKSKKEDPRRKSSLEHRYYMTRSPEMFPFCTTIEVQLRVVVLRFIEASTKVAEPPNHVCDEALQKMCLKLLLQSITSKVPEVVSAVRRVLKGLVAGENIGVLSPKVLVAKCLVPMLESLRDITFATIPHLEGLSFLLELLRGSFETHEKFVEIANTIAGGLLQTLQQWLQPQKIIQSQCFPRKEVDVAAALLDLFHKLPPNPTYMDKLVALTIRLDSVLFKYRTYGYISSPLRPALCRYLNEHLDKTIDYFVVGTADEDGRTKTRLRSSHYVNVWRYALKSPLSDSLRDKLREPEMVERLMKSTLAYKFATYSASDKLTSPEEIKKKRIKNQSVLELHLQGLWTVYRLAKTKPGWLVSQKRLKHKLVDMWRSSSRQKQLFSESMMNVKVQSETRVLIKCLLLLIEESVALPKGSQSNDFGTVIFDLLVIFTKATMIDFTFLADFYREKVAKTFPLKRK
eukprot:g4697.t1